MGSGIDLTQMRPRPFLQVSAGPGYKKRITVFLRLRFRKTVRYSE